MNSKLMEMLLAQTCGAGRPGFADLIARLNSAAATGALDPKELLGRLGNSNPAVASFLQQLSAHQETAAVDHSRVIDVEPVPEQAALPAESPEEEHDASVAELQDLRLRTEALCAEMKLLRERNDLLAAALGACCLCWGHDLSCRSCRGRGGPGFCIPDQELFEEYVVPAIHTFRAQKAKVQSLASAGPRRSVETETPLRSVANYSA